ncbi:MAG: glycine zipper 2TM domain-containing protein, partial [Alphaproteobacteria bacterium]|nr:glycine zipper 2TM domain-containing protein [Alphaproteobacteria bacterium]
TYQVLPQYQVTEINCSDNTGESQLLGAILGGVAGGVLGNQFGKGKGNDAATIGGALAGLLVGSNIGTAFATPLDQRCAGYALETAKTGSQIAWQNPDSQDTYAIVPTKTYSQEGRYCREYQSVSSIGGRNRQTYGTACRQPDGSWEIVSQ